MEETSASQKECAAGAASPRARPLIRSARLIHPLGRYVSLLESGELSRVVTVPVLVWNATPGPTQDATGAMRVTDEIRAMLREPASAKRSPNALVFELGSMSARTTIGRAEGCTIRLMTDSVSRMHLQLANTPGGWTACDLGSKNGSWVGSTRIPPGAHVGLTDGVRLQLGDVELFFMLPESFRAYVSQATH
jgi:hypothetical protein